MLNFHQVSTLPGTPQADSFYYVLNGNYAESYLTDDSGTAKMIGNSVMINALVDAKLATFETGIVTDCADITARDALSLDKNSMVMVYDASADATVSSGAALYYYDHSLDSFTKVAEYESLDISLDWSAIQNAPSSTPAQIDAAVSQGHSHANKTVLDDLSDNGGSLEYQGQPIGSGTIDWATNNW